MKYLFLTGRNIELSAEEIRSFLEKEGINFKIVSKTKNGILVETESKLGKIIDRLGGTVSIGEVIATGRKEKMFKELDSQAIYHERGNKLNYVVFDFNAKNYADILSYLKYRFKKEGLKATEKKPTGRIKTQEGESVSKVSSKLIHEQYFVFDDNFGRITEECDYEKIEKRDMGKPVRRNELSISPRLAKILINLSKAREGETILDPFCGVGTILQEALLQKIKAIGIDKDKKAIDNARLNMKWFKFSEKDYSLINGDSSKISVSNVRGIATEPDLGELHKKAPSSEKAKEIIKNFETLMIKVIKNLKKNVKGRIVFTAPLILADRNRISCDFNRISSGVGMKIIKGFPISEFRENSIVGRSIVVLESK